MKITVITITFNSERYLTETVSSVLAQEYPDLEYLIVDGGSTDGTLELIRCCAARDGRIRWISEPDRGIADAMNKGAALATGEVIAHLHSDDLYPDRSVLSRVAGGFAGQPGALWLTGGEYIIDQDGKILREIRVRSYSRARLLRSNCILHPATFLRRDAFMAAGGFDPRRKYAMDYDLWLRLAARGTPLLIDAPLACFRLHGGSLSTVEAEKAFDEEFAIRREFLSGHPVRLIFHRLYYQLKKRRNRAFMARMLER